MIDYGNLTHFIINPALKDLVMFSDDAMTLMLFTCAVESEGGSFIVQKQGKALGIYQMEPENYNDLWQNYISKKQTMLLSLALNFEIVRMPPEDKLIYDLRFATAMTRIFYHRIKEPLPDANDINAVWSYYKRNYNTLAGKATKEESIKKYYSFVKK